MKLIGLMLVRNEEWVLECSLRAALRWCDEVVVVDNGSVDMTQQIIGEVSREHPWRIHYSYYVPMKLEKIRNSHDGEMRDVEVQNPDGPWDEMDVRQHSLLLGRKFGGTHFALIDADEIPTANFLDHLRRETMTLHAGMALDVPMVAMRNLELYQTDDSVWSRAWLSVSFMDRPDLSFRPDITGYHHHHRLPYGVSDTRRRFGSHGHGGVMHVQFANERRLKAKHVLYRMVDHLRWPARESVEQLNRKYDAALERPKTMTPVPQTWWAGYDRSLIRLDGWPWQEGEIRRLFDQHGPQAFHGLDLKGMA